MGEWGFSQGSIVTAHVGAAASNYGVTMTASSSANTKGSWVTIGTTTTNAHAIDVVFTNPYKFGTVSPLSYLVDIIWGSTSSPNYLLRNFWYTGAPNKWVSDVVSVPMFVPSGATISGRCQADSGSSELDVCAYPVAFGWDNQPSYQRVQQYGASTFTSLAAQLDPGGTVDTKGSWTQLTASSTNPIKYMIVSMNVNNSAATTARWRVDIGKGAAGSETVIVPDLYFHADAASDAGSPLIYTGYFNVKDAVRLAARCQCDINDATDRLMYLQISGID